MEKIRVLLKKFWKEEEGTETVEWAIVAGLIIVAAIASWITIGGKVSTTIGSLATTMP